MGSPATAAVRLLAGEREPTRAATTANITLAGLQTVDGVALNVNDRVLVKNQTDARQNGIYTASEGPWARASDASFSRAMTQGVTVQVQQGGQGGRAFRFATKDPRIGIDAIQIAFYLSASFAADAENVITAQKASLTTFVNATSADFTNFLTTSVSAASLDFSNFVGATVASGKAQIESTATEVIAPLVVQAQTSAGAASSAADRAKGFVSDIVSQANVPVYDSRATASAYDLSAFRAVVVNRYTSSSALAAGNYQPVGSEPAHAAKFQDSTGQWFELAEAVPSVAMFGSVQDAVAFAFAKGVELYWPAGDFAAVGNVPNFHAVKHRGPGRLTRGSSVWTIEAKGTQENNFYVSTAGSAANDGLTADFPMAFIQQAFDAARTWGPVIGGVLVFNVAAGRFTGNQFGSRHAEWPKGLEVANEIVVQGPDVGGHPNEPVVFIGPAGETKASGNGLWFDNVRARVRNVKVMNLNGLGVVATNGGKVFTENVHTYNVGGGIDGTRMATIDVKGGIIDGKARTEGNRGIRSLFGCSHSIGNQQAGNTSQGPIVRNCATGMLAQESSVGHADFVTWEDNSNALDVQVNSRVNPNGSDFKRNVTAIRVGGNSVVLDPTFAGCNFNIGTANSNSELVRLLDGGRLATEISTDWREVAVSTTDTVSSGTTETTLATFIVDAYKLIATPSAVNLGKALRVKASGLIAGATGSKSFRLRLNGSILLGVVAEASAAGGFDLVIESRMTGLNAQRTVGRFNAGAGLNQERSRTGYTTSTVNTAQTATSTITLTVQCAVGTETVTAGVVSLELKG